MLTKICTVGVKDIAAAEAEADDTRVERLHRQLARNLQRRAALGNVLLQVVRDALALKHLREGGPLLRRQQAFRVDCGATLAEASWLGRRGRGHAVLARQTRDRHVFGCATQEQQLWRGDRLL